MAPAHDAVGTDDHDGAAGAAGRLEVGAERLGRRALGLEVRELLDADAELLLERGLGVARVGRDPAEGERVEDEDGRLAQQVLASELLAVLALQAEVGDRRPGRDDAHRRRPSSRMSSRYPSRSVLR